MRTVFVNPERCIGCLQCEIACAVEHSESKQEAFAFLERPLPRKRVHVEAGPVATTAYPNRCRHCDPAPCQRVCPTSAISRDDELGLVLVDAARCIGCAMCAVVCPFDVITFYPLVGGPDHRTAVAVKCDGCETRVRRGDTPACVEVCKVDALVYGDINVLVGQGRLRETGAVLAAASMHPEPVPKPDPLAGWRSWGEAMATAGRSGGNGRRPLVGNGKAASGHTGIATQEGQP